MITFDDLYLKLVSWGYKVSKEPEEKVIPGKLYMKYDMDMEAEDISMTSYVVKHEVELSWIELQPGTIATSVATLMGHLGKQYAQVNHFEMGKPKLVRDNGTTYKVKVSVYWMSWQTVDAT